LPKESENKITFIGTGGGRVIIASQMRNTGGFVINLSGHQVHVDPGPGALIKAKEFKINSTQTDIIFVSHRHTDHSSDLNALVEAITLRGVHKRGTLISSPSVIKGIEGYPAILQPRNREDLKDIYSITPGDNVKIGDLNFIACRTSHDSPDNLALKLESPKTTIGYTSDTAYCKELAEDLKGSKVLIMNVLRPGSDGWKTHFSTDSAVKLIENVRPELAIITHFGAKMIRANPLLEAREIQRRTGIRTIAVNDGSIINMPD